MLPLDKKFILILLIFLPHSAFPQIIKQIEVRGNNFFDSGEIAEWSGLTAGFKYSEKMLDSAKINLAKNFAQRGFLNPVFEDSYAAYTNDSASVSLVLVIKEGEPSYIRKIIIDNPDSSDLSSTELFSFLEGQIFNKNEIEENINSWLSVLENSGYPFARAVITSVEFSGLEEEKSFVDLHILLEHGIKSSISKIIINGNTSTKNEVIIRELRLNKNQIYSQNQIDEFPKRLNRLRFFEPIPIPEFFLNSQNEGVLSISVKEKQTNNFDGIIGYMPPSGDQDKGYLTGLVNVGLRNLFGTGRAASVRWQQYDRYSQELELHYLEPWVFSYPFNLSGGLFQRKQDTTYIQRRIEGMVEFLATEDISAGVIVYSEKVIPTLSEVPRFTVYNSSSFTTGLNLKIDTRDDPYAPTVGYLFLNTYSFSQKKIYGPSEFITSTTNTSLNLQRFMLDFGFFYQLFTRQVAALAIHARELRGSSFEDSDLFRLGGTNTLRGFRENQFLGSRIFWANFEYRFLLTRRSYVFLFSDNGYYLRKEEPDKGIIKSESYLSGYGAGLNIETGLGVLGVSYALEAGESFSNGKIHFGIINEF